MTTSRVKPSEDSWVQISSDYRRWCHALWRQLRLLSTPSRLPAAPAGSGSPPAPSAHLGSRSLLFSESVEITWWKNKFLTLQALSVVFFNTLFFYEAAGLLVFYLATSSADVGPSRRFSAFGHCHMFRLQLPGHLPGRLTVEQMQKKIVPGFERRRTCSRVMFTGWRTCKNKIPLGTKKKK